MDWNSFFSSLAQSVGALVGVFAAFIITKIVNNQAEFSKKVSMIHELVSLAKKHRDAAEIRYFAWYNRNQMKDALREVRDFLKEDGRERKTAEQYYAQLVTPLLYVPRIEAIQKIKEVIPPPPPPVAESDFDDAQSERRSTSPYRDFPSIMYTPPTAFKIYERESKDRLMADIQEEGEAIERLHVEIRQHIRLVKFHISAIEGNPESSTLISFSVCCAILLFLSGVIYPLSFLPFAADQSLSIRAFVSILLSLKGFMLAIPTIIFLTIMIVFWQVNLSLRYKRDDMLKLTEVAELGYYSNYFKIRADNQRDQAATSTK